MVKAEKRSELGLEAGTSVRREGLRAKRDSAKVAEGGSGYFSFLSKNEPSENKSL